MKSLPALLIGSFRWSGKWSASLVVIFAGAFHFLLPKSTVIFWNSHCIISSGPRTSLYGGSANHIFFIISWLFSHTSPSSYPFGIWLDSPIRGFVFFRLVHSQTVGLYLYLRYIVLCARLVLHSHLDGFHPCSSSHCKPIANFEWSSCLWSGASFLVLFLNWVQQRIIRLVDELTLIFNIKPLVSRQAATFCLICQFDFCSWFFIPRFGNFSFCYLFLEASNGGFHAISSGLCPLTSDFHALVFLFSSDFQISKHCFSPSISIYSGCFSVPKQDQQIALSFVSLVAHLLTVCFSSITIAHLEQYNRYRYPKLEWSSLSHAQPVANKFTFW